jgi:hypothetical protein
MRSLILLLALFASNQAAQPPASDNVTRARAVLTALAAGDFSSIEAQFTDQMKAALPPGRIAAAWTALLAQAGPQKGCAPEPRVVSIADKQMVITKCDFEKAAIDVQIAFDTDAKISGLQLRPAAAPVAPYAPPSYADPATYTEEELTIGSPEWALPGTLTMPVGAGPHPAVILVHGSGAGDRDTTIGPNKPFKDIALGLASRGVAVIRYDKRSRVHGAKMAASPSMTVKEETIDDVGEAIKALRARPRIDAARIFVIGHSLGGMLIPRIVQAQPSLAGAIVMAGAARPIDQAVVEQARYLAMQDGEVSQEEQALIDSMARNSATIQAFGPADVASAKRVLGATPAYWLDLRGYDPPSAARNVKIPLLVLQGERDYQVTMEEFARWKTALSGTATATFRSYPALNHLFIAGTGKSFPAEYGIPSHVAEDVIRDVAAFIKR